MKNMLRSPPPEPKIFCKELQTVAAKYLLSKNLERTDFDESGMARRRKAFSTRLLWESLVAQDRPSSLSLLEILEFPRFSI